jgi:hypothetical protein
MPTTSTEQSPLSDMNGAAGRAIQPSECLLGLHRDDGPDQGAGDAV